MMIVICYYDEEWGGRLVSHGIDSETLENIPLPQIPPSELGAEYSIKLGEYVIY